MRVRLAFMWFLAAGAVTVLSVSGQSATVVQSGTLYQARCAACHGVDGSANTAIARKENILPFSDPKVRSRSEDDLALEILEGGAVMRPSHVYKDKGLDREAALRLARYVKELGGKK